ncbi:MAG: hypothetical protein ABR573_06145 [Candidatus Dormibacteria bacterium]
MIKSGDGGALLVNYWYAHNVGHAVEALRYCQGYKAATPEMAVSVLLNAASPMELARCCRFVNHAFAVPYAPWFGQDDAVAALESVPRDWDYVVDNHRRAENDGVPGMDEFYTTSDDHFNTRIARCLIGRPPVPYSRNQTIKLELPDASREFAMGYLREGQLGIALMPGGSDDNSARYPSHESWRRIVGGLHARHPDARVFFVGRFGGSGTTTRIGRDQLDDLLALIPGSVDCFAMGIVDQLAIVEACSLFASVHTGFGSAAVAVGTPWVTLSGGPWPEYFFNGIPFRSIVPERRFPAYDHSPGAELVADVDGTPRTPSMTAERVSVDLRRFLDAADDLIEQRLTYESCMRTYFTDLLGHYDGDRARVWSFDNAHDAFI